jgi:tetratricopeptide (TPR) repeat protein
MKMTVAALSLGVAFVAVPAAAQMYNAPQAAPQAVDRPQAEDKDTSKEPQLRPSNGALKPIIDLQNSVNANDYASVPAKVAAASKVAKTPVDRYLIAQLQLKAALAAKDNAGMATAIDAVAASGYLDKAKTAELYQSLGATFYNAKQLDLAGSALEKAVAANPGDAQSLIMLGETRNAQGRKPEAVSLFQRALQASSAGGTKPEEKLYKRAVSIAYDAKQPAAIDLARQWVAAYPSTESWRNSIAIFRNLSSQDVEGTLDLLRLMQAAGALTSPADYNLFATAAADQANYPEAQAVIDAGIAAKQVDPTSPLFRDTIAGLRAKPKLTDAALAEAVKSATTGQALVRVGDRAYGMGQYAKAAELYRQGIAKGVTDVNVANLHLGMALARSGDKAGATAAFNAVTGQRADIAKYWLLYVNSH